MNIFIADKEIAVHGRAFRTAKLRHEWCDFLADPPAAVKKMGEGRPVADLFTFIQEIGETQQYQQFHQEPAGASVLPIIPYEKWFAGLDFKVRNKIRKAQKSGVELRVVPLDDEFAKGVEGIYNEAPVRQGRKFWHYGKKYPVIKEELSSFQDHATYVGAYHAGAMIGFMKLFHGHNVIRTVHIISKLSERDKPVMDALIAKAVEICNEKKISHLQYGSWATGGLGAFRVKHGFQRMDVARYFVPLTLRGTLMLKMKLHHPVRERLPQSWVDGLIVWRNKWNAAKFGAA